MNKNLKEKPSLEIEKHPEWFYRDRKGEIYPYYKEYIKEYVDPFVPSTFIPFLKEMDYPFFEDEWIGMLKSAITKKKDLSFLFGQYITKMKLCSFRKLTFEDSQYDKETTCYWVEIRRLK